MKIILKRNLPDTEIIFELDGNDWDSSKTQIHQIIHDLDQHEAKPLIGRQQKTPMPKSINRGNTKKAVSHQSQMIPDLLNSDDIPKIKDFFRKKSPTSHIENYTIITLWLRNNKNLSSISTDEIWTLYKVLNIKPPKNLMQVFRDGKSKKGYFDVDKETGKFYITNLGESFVTYDLPKKRGEENG